MPVIRRVRPGGPEDRLRGPCDKDHPQAVSLGQAETLQSHPRREHHRVPTMDAPTQPGHRFDPRAQDTAHRSMLVRGGPPVESPSAGRFAAATLPAQSPAQYYVDVLPPSTTPHRPEPLITNCEDAIAHSADGADGRHGEDRLPRKH